MQRDDEPWLAAPLLIGNDARAMRSVAAHVRQVVRLLRSPGATSPCSDAVLYVTGLFDRTVPAAAKAMIACTRGCSHCCQQLVTLTAAEAFTVAAQIRNRPQAVNAVAAADAKTRGLSLEQRLKVHEWCPLLEDGLCSVYEARPLGCHGFVSAKLDACLAAFINGATPQIPQPADTVTTLHACRMLLLAALRIAGLSEVSYEMNAAVALALTVENSERRWLDGANVLAGAEMISTIPPQIAFTIRGIVAQVAPTV